MAGSLGEGYQTLYNNKGFDGIYSIIVKPMGLEYAMDNAAQLLENASENIMKLWKTKIR